MNLDNIIGNCYFKQKDYLKVLEYSKDNYQIGFALNELGYTDEATQYLLKSNHPDINRLLGDIYSLKLNKPKEAICYYERVKGNALVYHMLGHLYEKLDYWSIDKQLYYFKEALKLNPNFKEAHKNIAIVLQKERKFKEAEEHFKKLESLGMNNDDIYDYGALKVIQEDFSGFQLMETRFKKDHLKVEMKKFIKSKWDGQINLDKVLLVHWEQGFGDTIQFSQFIPDLSKKFRKVIFNVQPELYELFKYSFKNIEIVSMNNLPEHDYYISVMSLPHLLNITKDNMPFSTGFLNTNKKLQIPPSDKFKVGINWQCKNVYEPDFLRSIDNVNLLNPLFELPNIEWYSIQKKPAEFPLGKLPFNNVGKLINDFNDTASIVKQLDLVISIDSAPAHLVGALDIPIWVMLPYTGDWRWGLNDTTPFYFSAKLFRQNKDRTWGSVIEQIKEKLIKLTTVNT